jgi:hypothetical protein
MSKLKCGGNYKVTRINTEILKKYIAPAIDEKPDLTLPDLTEEFEASKAWMQQYFLSSVFHGEFTGVMKLYAESIIARIQIVFSGYHEARSRTILYVDHWRIGNPGIGRYLAAIGEWESIFLNLQILFDLKIKFLGATLSPGEKEDRVRKIANRIKHVGEDIQDGKLMSVGMPMWLTKSGFAANNATLTYEEMGEQVRFMAQIADCLSLPSQAQDKFAALQN